MKVWSPGVTPDSETMVRLAAAEPFVRDKTVDDDIIVEGWFTTESLNAYGQVVLAKSFAWDEGTKLFNGRILAFHDQGKEPIGYCESMRIVKGKGLWGRVRVFRESSPLFQRAVREGVLNGFSIGFIPVEHSFDEKTNVITFTKCKLMETSIVNVGANEEALFEVVHSIERIHAQLPDAVSATPHKEAITHERKAMATDIKVVDEGLLTLDRFETEKQELQKNIDELKKLQHTLDENVKSINAGMITKAEFLQRVDKMSKDFETLAEDIEKGKNAMRLQREELWVYNDYRSMLQGYDYLQHEDGRQFDDIDYRGYALFQMPVDIDKFDKGQELRNLRNLHDAVLLIDRLHRFQSIGGKPYILHRLPIWAQFQKAVERFDPTLAHAMAGGNAGYGAEWTPTDFSAEFNEYLRIQPTLPNRFRTWIMPKGQAAKYPFQNGKAKVYKGGESLVDNAAQARKTNIATQAHTFTPSLFIGALVASENITEDSIVDLVGLIRQELAIAITEGLESAIINGDAAATHQDNAGGGAHYATYDVETAFDGLRAEAFDNSATYSMETLSGDTGVGAVTVNSLKLLKNKMGVSGVRSDECLFITGIKGRQEIQQAFEKSVDAGMLSYIISGTLPKIDGADVYISGLHNEDLDSDGLGHASLLSGAHTSIECVHLPSWRIGQRRGVTLEMAKDILTQQQQFVATARYDFGCVAPTAVNPVVCGIDVQHT